MLAVDTHEEELKTCAAVAFETKKLLEIVELDLEDPKAGEVLVEIIATGLCHTDAYTLDGLTAKASSRASWGMRARVSLTSWRFRLSFCECRIA